MIKENNPIERKVESAEKNVQDKNKIDEQVIKLAKEAIQYKNAKMIYLIAYNFYEDLDIKTIEEMAEAIINIGNERYIFDFANSVPNAPIEKLGEAMSKSKDLNFIIEFATKIKNAPIELLADAVVESGNANAIYKFAFYVDKAPKEKLAKAILNCGSEEDCEAFAIDVMHMSLVDLIVDYAEVMTNSDEDELE